MGASPTPGNCTPRACTPTARGQWLELYPLERAPSTGGVRLEVGRARARANAACTADAGCRGRAAAKPKTNKKARTRAAVPLASTTRGTPRKKTETGRGHVARVRLERLPLIGRCRLSVALAFGRAPAPGLRDPGSATTRLGRAGRQFLISVSFADGVVFPIAAIILRPWPAVACCTGLCPCPSRLFCSLLFLIAPLSFFPSRR